jgi:hypothetical protein
MTDRGQTDASDNLWTVQRLGILGKDALDAM